MAIQISMMLPDAKFASALEPEELAGLLLAHLIP